MAAGGQRLRTVERPDIIEAEKAALKEVQVLRVFSIYPPGEVQTQLMEDPFQEGQVTSAALIAVILEYPHCRPSVHRGIDVAECPLIRRQLAVRMHQRDLA